MRDHNFQLGDRVVYHANRHGAGSTPAYEGLVGEIERIDPIEIQVRWDNSPRPYEPLGYCISDNLQLATPVLTTHRSWLP